MKKIVFWGIVFVFCLSLSACGKEKSTPDESDLPKIQEQVPLENEIAGADWESEIDSVQDAADSMEADDSQLSLPEISQGNVSLQETDAPDNVAESGKYPGEADVPSQEEPSQQEQFGSEIVLPQIPG